MRVLFVTSEVAPITKFGGLGDFSASLPKALQKRNCNVDIIFPYYEDAKTGNLKVYKHLTLAVPFNNKTYEVDFHKTKLPDSNVDVLMVKIGLEFSGDFIQDVEFYSFFDRCVVEYIKSRYNTYDVVHCNDWHTGLVTYLLEDEIGESRPKTLLTIHNLGYQGISSPDLVKEMGLVPGEHPLIEWDLKDGSLNLLLHGISSADYVNTVSESYAKELLTENFGGSFAKILSDRKDTFVGILNGIDYTTLPRNYDITNWEPHKSKYKKELQQKLGLEVGDAPLFSYISRLDPGQKGLDIMYESIPAILQAGGQFVLLGVGDKKWEEKLISMTKGDKFKRQLSINIEFNVDLATKIYEGSDFFFVPSRYEPCGLTQMMAMWYGTVPIVRNVGGLRDSVTEGQNGFVFDEYSSKDLIKATQRALKVYKNKKELNKLIEGSLNSNFGWEKSAQKYLDIYKELSF